MADCRVRPGPGHDGRVGWQVWAGLGAGLLISVLTTPVGVSGAVFLLPVQLDLLAVPSPRVTPTNRSP